MHSIFALCSIFGLCRPKNSAGLDYIFGKILTSGDNDDIGILLLTQYRISKRQFWSTGDYCNRFGNNTSFMEEEYIIDSSSRHYIIYGYGTVAHILNFRKKENLFLLQKSI